ncbi:hypothetical protein HMPREF1417_00881 [Helicobacter pylori GAM260Bi]|uniref:Uncharacterized protein n=1 Tax=Helicobacter pylori HP260AFii TaxID=1159077 RepID=A0ABC9SBD5_HELPX|nr:hypothetical protein HMPREF1417_00881 [Helicobacter pylori GAM260Bi]EMH21539.1 hypothetical protein HMPREF1416_00204 [Helicobacter pylori GAM260ASi]EMH27615.1 hypothetical protein HMPREF1422_01407 [Helicobacter pylori GAM268Bii]EMH63437.1 hypothetical protein HMPREF1448_00799 [Helicobacter pylori HP260AFi]EMH68173.1 hypothetical protein HMPREF1449_00307 [Helicobacter pylori HP260AFii]EMH68667.1 hypothetical protein HMPREF1450_00456 [Helicobacter pylori HP260ASii]
MGRLWGGLRAAFWLLTLSFKCEFSSKIKNFNGIGFNIRC